jgi:hypothetical protein
VDCAEVFFTLDSLDATEKSAFGLGRELVKRIKYDWSVKRHPSVSLESGRFPAAGGTKKNPKLAHSGNVLLRVQDVPIPMVEREIESGRITWVEIPEREVPISPEIEYLLQKRAHYKYELDEIGARLETLGWKE